MLIPAKKEDIVKKIAVLLVVVFVLFAVSPVFAGEKELPTAFVIKNNFDVEVSYIIRPLGAYTTERYFEVKGVKPGQTVRVTLEEIASGGGFYSNLASGDPVRALINVTSSSWPNAFVQYGLHNPSHFILIKKDYVEKERYRTLRLGLR